MTTHLISKVYIVWSSAKGGKWLEDIFLSKEKANEYCEKMNQVAAKGFRYRIEEKVTGDYIIYDDMWEDNK